jgi:eukaryotic-like serine/threonine-protein kinase
MLLTGKVLGRCYLEGLIGEGASSQVYKGMHQTLGIPVAVKVLRTQPHVPGALQGVGFRERFRREAQMAARLSHEGIVRVLDFGEEMGLLYLVMEFIDGRSLLDYLRQSGPVHEELALKIIAHIASSMHVAHSQQILHRDLKPANILVTKDGKLKVSDLGLAKDMTQIDLTAADTTLGTPTYMAPECFLPGKEIGPASDIYSMGVMLYELIVGKPPYVGTLNQVISGHLHSEPSWVLGGNEKSGHDRVNAPAFSPGTLKLVKLMMAKKAEDRPASCREVVELAHARLRELRGLAPGQTYSGPSSESLRRTDHLADSSSFRKMGELLDRNLGSRTSEYQGKTVVHTTGRERLVIWLLLVAFIVGLLLVYLRMRV